MNIEQAEGIFDSWYEDDREMAEWARDFGPDLIEYVKNCKSFFDQYKDWILRGNDTLDEKELMKAIEKLT